MNIKINVSGMVCEGCEKRIKNALGMLDGVTEVLANHQTGVVEINANKEISLEDIKIKITDIGFTVVEDK